MSDDPGFAEEVKEKAEEEAKEKAEDEAKEKAAEGMNLALPEPLTREVPDVDPQDISEKFGVSPPVAYLIRGTCGLVKLDPMKAGGGSNSVAADYLRAAMAYLRIQWMKRKQQAQEETEDSDGGNGSDDMPQGQGPMGD